MSKVKHTPGPWRLLPLEGKYYYTEIAVGDSGVIRVSTPDYFLDEFGSTRERDRGWEAGDGCDHVEDARTLANAHLIVAAPEMLVALKTIVNKLRDSGDASNELGRCMNAIAKAEGREQ